MSYSLGVDLGTTFSAAAVARDSEHAQPEMVTLSARSLTLPSVAFLAEDGTLLFGEAALRREVGGPERAARAFKRRLGDPTPLVLAGRQFTPVDLLAATLRHILERVAEVEGGPPRAVVVTYPANWGPYRRGLFEEVLELGGLAGAAVDTITEPAAAAYQYALTRPVDDERVLAVYDLGGGTFDATVLRQRPRAIELLGVPEGIERLGGIDFDEAVLGHVNHVLGRPLDAPDARDARLTSALARLRQDCVLAKEALSTDIATTLPVFLPDRHTQVDITRETFEALVRAPLESTVGALARTLRSAHVEPAEVEAILLVGGSSRIPLVAQMVTEQLGRPVVLDTHPKNVVALGAAAYALGVAAGAVPTSPAPSAANGGDAYPGAAGPGGPHPRASTTVLALDPPPGPDRPHGDDGERAAERVARDTPVPTEGTARRAGSRRWWLAAAALVVLVSLAVILLVNRAGPARSGTQTVALPSPPEAVAAAPDGRSVYVTTLSSGGPGVVFVVDTNRGRYSVTDTIAVPAGSAWLALTPDGSRAYVTGKGAPGAAGAVSVVDTVRRAVLATVPVGQDPGQVAVAPDGRSAYVANQDSNSVTVLDTGTNTVAATIAVGQGPNGLAVSPDGQRVYVTNQRSNTVSVLDTRTRQVSATLAGVPSPNGIALNPDGGRAYIAESHSGSVAVLDTRTGTVRATIAVGQSPSRVAVGPDGRVAYVTNQRSNTVTEIDTVAETARATLAVGSDPLGIALSPGGRNAYVADHHAPELSVLKITPP